MILNGALATARLIIRPFTPADAAPLVELFADPKVARFVGDGEALSREDADLWITRSGENHARHGYGTGAVTLAVSGDLVGWAGFARPEAGGEEIIYGLSRAYWGQGYGAEILAALIAFAEERGVRPMRATVSPANAASVRLLEAHGFALAHKDIDPGTDLYERP